MCGIVGCAGMIGAPEEKIFKNLLDICQLRGRDSTGVITVDTANKVRVAKELGPPSFLKDTRRFNQAMSGMNKVLIGHCRHKTAGEVNLRNAHPFVFDNVVGVHNGTLAWSWKRGKDASQFDVDSEFLYSRLNVAPPEEVISTEISEEGAWALNWWNTERNTLNFLRNEKRPLSFAWNKTKDVMWWASEAWMLWAVDRDQDCLILDKDEGNFTNDLPVNFLWSFKVTRSMAKTFEMTPIKEIKGASKGFFPAAVAAVSNRVGFQANRANSHGSTGSSSTTGGSGVKDPFPAKPDGNLGHGAAGKMVTPSNTNTSGKSTSKITASTKQSSTSKNSKRPVLSLVSGNSSASQKTSKSESSVDSKKSQSCCNQEQTTPLLWESSKSVRGKETSLRNVAGIWYISSKSLAFELSEQDFERVTGAVCCWCKKPIGSLEEVSTFISTNEFVCTTCD